VNQDEAKLLAARAAIEELPQSGVIGLGSGSTAKLFVDEVGARVKNGADYRGVPTSKGTRAQAEALGIPLLGDEDAWGEIAVTVDGADEVDEHLNLIKGGGGALTREKILAGAARRFVCIVDESKLVAALGRFPLPIEVIPMAVPFVSRQMVKAGGQPILREGFVTDNGNQILDVHNLRIANPVEMEMRFSLIPGVVTVGLFANRGADVLLIGGSSGVKTLQ